MKPEKSSPTDDSKHKLAIGPTLPVNAEGFRSDASRFFALSVDELKTLVAGLEKQGTLFSHEYVARTLKVRINEAESIRNVLLFLLHQMIDHKTTLDTFVRELTPLGVDRQKVELVYGLYSQLNAKTTSANGHLLDIIGYTRQLEHLGDVSVAINYTLTNAAETTTQIMFPLFRVIFVSTRKNESKRISFDMDANEFQSLIIRLQESLRLFRTESDALKRDLGEKYTALVGE
jgi:hypothetical protein